MLNVIEFIILFPVYIFDVVVGAALRWLCQGIDKEIATIDGDLYMVVQAVCEMLGGVTVEQLEILLPAVQDALSSIA